MPRKPGDMEEFIFPIEERLYSRAELEKALSAAADVLDKAIEQINPRCSSVNYSILFTVGGKTLDKGHTFCDYQYDSSDDIERRLKEHGRWYLIRHILDAAGESAVVSGEFIVRGQPYRQAVLCNEHKSPSTAVKTQLQADDVKVPVGSHEGKTIVVASDHRGFRHKSSLVDVLSQKGYPVIDVGTFSSERCDYPAISDELGSKVSEDPYGRAGIGICGSGNGILILAGKHQGVYPVRCATAEEAKASRKHNNSNVLGISADCISIEASLAVVDAWLTAPFYSREDEKVYFDRFVQTVMLEKRRFRP